MSDISLNMDGVVSFLVAGALAFILFLAILILGLMAWAKGNEAQTGGFPRRVVVRHIVGLSLSLVGFLAVMGIVLSTDGPTRSRAAAVWLDRWLLLWLAAIIALWPATVLWMKRGNAR